MQSGFASVGRRRFIEGAACLSGLARAGKARAENAAGQPSLSGDAFDLTIAETEVNVTGRPASAIGVNGGTPAPILRWRQGDTVTLKVTNRLLVPSSIHWHGIRAPAAMDGVPGLSFPGIAPGENFTYRIPVHQSGTYWYHSHSMFQEQTGLYGAIIVEPRGEEYAEKFDREHVVLLSDWSDVPPEHVLSNLKFQSDYYDFHQRTLGSLPREAAKKGLAAAVSDRLTWAGMRMSATDIADVTGSTYTYLVNGQSPAANWTGLFRPGERVRLRFINASAMTFFDVRIPGLKMTVVQADGNDVEPVAVDEFRIGVAETYDVIVQPTDGVAYTIFAQSEDRTGAARGTLATRNGMIGAIPAMDRRPVRTMADMGMADMGKMGSGTKAMDKPPTPAAPAMNDMPGMAMAMPQTTAKGDDMKGMDMSGGMTATADAKILSGRVGVDNVAMSPTSAIDDPGDGLNNIGRRVLSYADLRATRPGADPRPPSRDIILHLTGNMNRYIWGFDGKKFSDADPIRLRLGERVRFTLINDTMMEHPIHLHGLWSELENGQGEYRPYKHTIIAQPGRKVSYLVTADEPGMWAYHCHLMYHMEMGMFRTVIVA